MVAVAEVEAEVPCLMAPEVRMAEEPGEEWEPVENDLEEEKVVTEAAEEAAEQHSSQEQVED